MADDFEEIEVPDGAAIFPLIPPELGVNPLLLATLHAVVFLVGSSEDVVQPAAGDEALENLIVYLRGLSGPLLDRVKEDMETLVGFARQNGWPKQDVHFLKTFLANFGVGDEPKA